MVKTVIAPAEALPAPDPADMPLWLIVFKIQYLVGNKPRIGACH